MRSDVFGFENIETLDEDGHNERYHRPYISGLTCN